MSIGAGCDFSKAIHGFDQILHDESVTIIFDGGVECGIGRNNMPELVQDRLQWETIVGCPKERRYTRIAGVAPDVDIIPFNNDLRTLQRAVVERVFTVKSGDGFSRPPRPEVGHFERVLAPTFDLLVKRLPSTAPISHQKFVDSYRGRKQMFYQKALDEIRAGRTNLEDDAKLNVFVKYEKTDVTTKKDPVPRVISPRDPKFNIRVGRYLKPLEKRIFKSLSGLFKHPTVLKGFNAERSAELLKEKWDMFQCPVAVGLDASRFDQHVSLEALRWEHQVYLNCFPQRKHRERLQRLLKLQEINHCAGFTPDGRLKYTVKGTRMSGDMNTSLGNCVLMVSMIKAYALERGINLQLANNGDDCVVFLEKSSLEKFSAGLYEWFLKLGFNMAIEKPVFEFEGIEFCQTKPIFDGNTWIMCRNPFSAIVKDSVMLKPYQSPGEFRGWLAAVGMGGLRLAGGLPIFQELYKCYSKYGLSKKNYDDMLSWSFRHSSVGMKREYGTVHPAARASMYWAFDITPDEQLCLEKYYSQLELVTELGSYVPRSVFA